MDHLELKNDLRSSPLFSEDFKKTCTVLEFLIYSGMEFHVFTPLRAKAFWARAVRHIFTQCCGKAKKFCCFGYCTKSWK